MERSSFLAAQRTEDFIFDALLGALGTLECEPASWREDDDVPPPVGLVR